MGFTGQLGTHDSRAGNLVLGRAPEPDGALAGTIAATSSLNGALSVARGLAGTITGTSDLTGALLSGSETLLAGTIAGSSSLSGSLGRARPIAGSIDAAAAVSGELRRLKALAGTINGQGQLSATLGRLVLLAGSIDGDASLSAWLSQPQFVLWNNDTDAAIAYVSREARSLSLAGLLAEGWYTLGLSYFDQYDSESERALIDVQIDAGGNVAVALVEPTNISARPLTGGHVQLGWQAVATRQQVYPTEYEIAEAGNLAIVLLTVPHTAKAYAHQVGPFAHGASVQLAVRSHDGAGQYSDWQLAAAVTADAEGPPVPTILV